MPYYVFPPSLCNQGFIVDDPRSPVSLGKGFGPKFYQELFAEWDSTCDATYDAAVHEHVRNLISRMIECDEAQLYEGVFSGIISSKLQQMVPLLTDDASLCVVHQTFVPDGTNASADIALLDMSKGIPLVLSLLETKWRFSHNEFPESQACALASCFHSANATSGSFTPVFVLSKTHYLCGVAYRSFQGRWCYSEICEFVKGRGLPFLEDNDEDVRQLSRFITFFFRAAIFSRDYSKDVDTEIFVDFKGENQFSISETIGGRVFLGEDSKGNQKVLKMYANHSSAEIALEKIKTVSKVLDHATSATEIKGCGWADLEGGICAIQDDFFVEAGHVTVRHFSSLVTQVDKLWKAKIVHGDLRVPNILFLDDGVVRLIDFDWSGPFGEACFPATVNAAAFKTNMSRVYPQGKIPSDFDFYCVAEILKVLGNPAIAKLAFSCKADKVLNDLKAMKENTEDFTSKICADDDGKPLLKVNVLPNLSHFSKRLTAFYSKRTRSVKKRLEGQEPITNSITDSQ